MLEVIQSASVAKYQGSGVGRERNTDMNVGSNRLYIKMGMRVKKEKSS